MAVQQTNSQLRMQCTLQHKNGEKFNVFLTQYEINEANTNQKFAVELIEKYYKLYKNQLINCIPANKNTSNTLLITTAPASAKNYALNQNSESADNQADPDEEEEEEDIIRDYMTADDDELLISLVTQRPPLFDFRLPLRERSREITQHLWEEVISELNIKIDVKQVSSRWKNIRDSYLRARANVNKKLASGSSAEEKIKAEAIKQKHKHYCLLQFLDDTFSPRQTSSNITLTSSPQSTTSVAAVPRKKRIDNADEQFLSSLKDMYTNVASTSKGYTGTQMLCLRLAEGLERLPYRIRSQLEIKFMQQLAEAEHCTD